MKEKPGDDVDHLLSSLIDFFRISKGDINVFHLPLRAAFSVGF